MVTGVPVFSNHVILEFLCHESISPIEIMLASVGLRRPGNSDSVLERLHELGVGHWALALAMTLTLGRFGLIRPVGRAIVTSCRYSSLQQVLVPANPKSIQMTWRQDVTTSTRVGES